MADFVRYDLEDGSEVIFETSEGSLVAQRGGQPQMVDGGKLGDRLAHIAQAAEEISRGLRETLGPDEIELSFGVKVSGQVSWWFIANAGGEASMAVTLRWKDIPAARDASPPSSGMARIGAANGEPRQSPAALGDSEVTGDSGGE